MMDKTLSNISIGLLIATLLFFSGCDEKTSVKTIKEGAPKLISPIEKKVDNDKKIEPYKIVNKSKKDQLPKVDNSDIYSDSAYIKPNGKYMIIIFESDKCPYCAKMNLDIHNNKKLHDKLKKDFTVYNLNALKNRIHKLDHEGKPMDVDTQTLIDIYNVTSTPTLIFTDKKGKSIFVVPGYMPQKQFLVTLDFVESGLWLGKDRKNGEIYKTLKDFYEKHGIMVGKHKNK